jgi:hypothetical protein
MAFDGPDFLDIVFSAERLSGLKFRKNAIARAKLEERPNGLSVADAADVFCAMAEINDEQCDPCPSFTAFESLTRRLQEQLCKPIELRPDTPLRDIHKLLPTERRRDLCQALDVESYLVSGAGLVLVFLFPTSAVLLGLETSLMEYWCFMPLCLVLAMVVTFLIGRLLSRIIVRYGPLPRFLTLSDLICATMLYNKRNDSNTGPWTKSDMCLLARYVVATEYGCSVRDVPQRKKLHDIPIR